MKLILEKIAMHILNFPNKRLSNKSIKRKIKVILFLNINLILATS